MTASSERSRTELSETRQQVLRLFKADVRPRQIADLLGISTQRVYQHIERLRILGFLEEKAS